MDSSEVQIQIAVGAEDEMIEELCSLSENLEIYLFPDITCKPSIKLIKDAERGLNLWSEADLMESNYILEVSCALPHLAYRWFGPNEDRTKVPESEWNHRAMTPELAKQICDILICCNVSRVDSIVCTGSLVFENGEYDEYIKIPPMNSFCIERAAELAKDIQWPKLHTIEFRKVWNWATKNEGFLKGYGGGATGRALNAFSRLFELVSKDEAQQLMWSLVGIEALYGNGRSSVMEQIREKTQVLLGKQANFKKKINEMYDFRSRFMHGDVDFPGLSFQDDAMDEDYLQYWKKQTDTVGMATAILIATLQEMILRDWSGLEFTYAVSDTK